MFVDREKEGSSKMRTTLCAEGRGFLLCCFADVYLSLRAITTNKLDVFLWLSFSLLLFSCRTTFLVAAAAFLAWLRTRVPEGVECHVEEEGRVRPALTPVDHPAVRAAANAIEAGSGVEAGGRRDHGFEDLKQIHRVESESALALAR